MKRYIFVVLLLSCDPYDEVAPDVPDAEEPEQEPVAEVVVVPETAMPVVEAPAVISASVAAGASSRRTAVQAAPDFHMEAFSLDPVVARAARARVNRRRKEVDIIGNDQALYDVTKLVLGRLFVSESNWIYDEKLDARAVNSKNRSEVDGPSIFRVLRNTRMNGETLMGIMRRHSHYVTEQWTPRTVRTQWIVELNLEGRKPAHFPEGLNWERDYLPRWNLILELADALMKGHRLGPCGDAPIIAWGGRCEDAHGACDDHIAEERGLAPYEECAVGGVEPKNRFWCRPGVPGCAAVSGLANPPDPPVVITTTL